MRNTSEPMRGTWATYVLTGRERAGLTKSEFARRIGKDRATVGRWEDGKNRPDDADLVARVAEVLGFDLDEALAAAGLRPGVAPPATPTMEVDEEIELVRTDPKLDEDMKRRIIALILERREREKAAALEETRRLIDLFRRS
ncbi:helix-turn-helix transcriptional regulator [Micromonospora haikouensis]|uniref:helix-turn-helix transcriptional regulator n=1 Tax=Micromonospora haikouensis TaxID=686309 RepID=UPI00378D4EB9